MAKDNGELPRVKTWRDGNAPQNGGNQTAHNLGPRTGASAREKAGQRAAARPLKFELPPDDPQAISKFDKAHLPSNLPHEHR
jgi:hypothetical protein